MIFKIENTANFIHEITHGGQFENGDFAFSNLNSGPVADDVFDEVAAYKAQYAFDPSSVSKLQSTSVADGFGMITASWVQGIVKPDGDKPYAQGGIAHVGISSININSTRADLIKAYPEFKTGLMALPVTYTLKSDTNVIYKH